MNSPKGENEGDFDPPVFYTAIGLLLLLVAYAMLFADDATARFEAVQAGIVANMSWYYVLVVAFVLISVATTPAVAFWRIRTQRPRPVELDHEWATAPRANISVILAQDEQRLQFLHTVR